MLCFETLQKIDFVVVLSRYFINYRFPAKVRRESVVDKISKQALTNEEHPLHCLVAETRGTENQRLKSRRPFYRSNHCSGRFDIMEKWNEEWTQHPCPNQLMIDPSTDAPLGSNLPQTSWVVLNQLRAGVGRFGANMHRWGFRSSASCACGAADQTVDHILHNCDSFRPPDTVFRLTAIDDKTQLWPKHLSDAL